MNEERVQAGIQAAADELVISGEEIGLQVAVIKNGRVVADVVSGVTDSRTEVAVSGDTLFSAAQPEPIPGVSTSSSKTSGLPGKLLLRPR
jgi:hypothetical protein